MSKLFNPTLSMVLIASFLVVGYAAPSVAQEALWPAKSWSSSTPETQGLESSHFAKLDGEIKAGQYGYVDRMVVVRHGRLVVSKRYQHDYKEISRGHKSALGCGKVSKIIVSSVAVSPELLNDQSAVGQ